MVGVIKMEAYKKLENKYAKFVGSKYAISCNSGTSALHLALLAIGIKEGDEVIVPDFTMAACGFAVSYCGAKPVFVDCGDDLQINTKLIEEKITKKTRAIMAVHIYGKLCNMKEIRRIADKYDLDVVEDACEAQGAVYNSIADITCYSFYKNKIIHAEEGGICTTNNKRLADRISYFKNMAFGDKHDYFHSEIGYNYRMPESMAEMALQSLKNYPQEKKRRRMFEKTWNQVIKTKKRDAVWVYDFLCDDEFDREIKMKELKDKGIQVRYFFKPLSTMPMWSQQVGKKALEFSKKGMYICI